MNIIPAIDLIEGKCVRLSQGQFDRQTTYDIHPEEMAVKFRNEGAVDLHIVDLNASKSGRQTEGPTIRNIIEKSGLNVQLGGGIRTLGDARNLIGMGVKRVVIGSLAVKNPAEVLKIFEEIGPAAVILAFDIRFNKQEVPEIYTSGWEKKEDLSLWEMIDRYIASGLNTILCTDIDRDGMLVGPNLDLYADLTKRYPDLSIQSSGGVGKIEDIKNLKELGVKSCIVGKAIYEERFSLAEAISC